MTETPQIAQVVVPPLGENVSEATITRWLKSSGDRIDAGEPLLEIATDKVESEVPSPAAGILAAVFLPEGAVVHVGDTLAELEELTSSPDGTGKSPASPPASIQKGLDGPASRPAGAVGASAEETTDAANKHEHGHDENRVEKLPRIRQTIARRMVESLQTSAQLTTVVEADLTQIAKLRVREKEAFHERFGVKLSFLPFVAAAAVELLKDHAVINSSVNSACTEVTYHSRIHLGMAIDSERGLMVPVIRDAGLLGIPALAVKISDSAQKVRAGKISEDDFAGGTFTITNTGSRGALFDTPIINQPQSAILGIGAVVERVLPRRGSNGELEFTVRSMAHLSLSYDHRIVDGADAAKYLTALRQRLESGYTADDLR